MAIIRYFPSKKEEVMQLVAEIEPFKDTALSNYWENEPK
jgi:hypothetical protein